jgi:hypothetical protein
MTNLITAKIVTVVHHTHQSIALGHNHTSVGNVVLLRQFNGLWG